MGYGLVTSLYKYKHKKPTIINSKLMFNPNNLLYIH